MKDKMELTIGICVGSSIVWSIHFLVFSDSVLIAIGFLCQQIATFVVPLLVVIGWW